MCGLSGRPLARLKIDINISRHIGRDSQTPAPVCSHYHYTLCPVNPLQTLRLVIAPLLSPYWHGRVLSGVVIVTDEAPVLGWGGPGPGNDIMTGWPCTHHTSHITPWHHTHIPHSALTTLGPSPSSSPVSSKFLVPLNTLWSPLENRRLFSAWLTRGGSLLEGKWKVITSMNHCHWIVLFLVTTWCVCEVFRPEPPPHHPHQHTRRGRHLASIGRCQG